MNKSFRCIAIAAIFVVAIGAMSSCFKSKTTDTLLIMKVLLQEKSGGENVMLTDDIMVYGYEVEDDDWYIASYDDALNCTITDSLAVERRSVPDLQGEPFTKEGLTATYTSIPLVSSPTMVVVVCPTIKMYAYSFRTLDVINLHETYITLLLHSWKTAQYTEGTAAKGGIWYIFPPEKEATDDNNTGGVNGGLTE